MENQQEALWKEFNDNWSPIFEDYFHKIFIELEDSWLSSRGAYPVESDRIGEKVNLFQAMIYASTGGKRVRPLLMALSYYSVSLKKPWKDPLLMEFASALEMIHSYSLVHDDLPGMDDDKYRRGKLTVHAKFGESTGILTGDALLNHAFERACLAISRASDEKKDIAVKALLYLSKIAGVQGMIGGQALDLIPELLDNDAHLSLMVEKKTCCLFMGACRIGGLIGGASQKELDALTDFALYLGLAYQMKDDNQDREKDLKNAKVTYATIFDAEKLQEKVEEYTRKAIETLSVLSQKDFLVSLARKLVKREK